MARVEGFCGFPVYLFNLTLYKTMLLVNDWEYISTSHFAFDKKLK